MLVFRLHRRLLRAPLLVLLMLGMVISPTLAAVSELHDVEHAADAGRTGAHGHPHFDSAPHGHHGGEADPEHTSGVHGLLHQAGSASVALPQAALVISMAPVAAPRLPEFARFHLPGDSPTHPFRPPIA